jgi:hypothetical protein
LCYHWREAIIPFMLRDKKSFLRILTTVLLAGGMLGMMVGNSVDAAPAKIPAQQVGTTDTPTETSTDTPTIPLTPTETATGTITPTGTTNPDLSPTATQTSTEGVTPTSGSTSTRTRTPTRTRTFTRTPSPTRTLTPSPTRTPTPTITNTGTLPTPTPSAPRHIVISEFRTIGPMGAEDEFVELYNPTGAPVNIGYWVISKSSGCGSNLSTLVTIYYGTVLKPGQHYLAAAYASSSSIATADQRFAPGIANNGGLALLSSGGSMVDQVGMCAETYYYEGKPLPPLPVAPLPGTPTPEPGTSDQSYERKPGGNTSCYDTNNNVTDFSLISPANPQSQAYGTWLCAGVVLTSPTPSPTTTITLTRTPTHGPTAIPAAAVLNEFLPHPQNDWNGDGTANVGDEYIEIINVSSSALSMAGWKIDMGADSPTTFTLPDMTLQPRQIATFFGTQTGLSLSDGGGTVRLLKSDGRIVDAYTYPIVEIPERTWCRLPDGSPYWGFTCRPTPNQPNMSVSASSTGTGTTVGGASNCPQGNIAPEALVLAECGSFGAGITNTLTEGAFWLQSRWKWGVFLE